MHTTSINNIFVFVVCGEAKHIETLHYSLAFLLKFSQNQILVVTDTKRNEVKINHPDILDIPTPQNYNNHQASIWLKTSLNNILPEGPLYCYLDSDVIALNRDCDKIFSEYQSPITFASDHCKLNEFSPYAVNCNCLIHANEQKNKLNELIKKHNPYFEQENLMNNMVSRDFYRLINKIKKQPFLYLHKIFGFIFLNYLWPSKKIKFKLTKSIFYDKKRKLWVDKENKPILYHVLNYYKKIENESELRFKLLKTSWYNKENKNIYMTQCKHLSELIHDKFNIEIKNPEWQHWNGGVFLFNKESSSFMNSWHEYTKEIFSDSNWNTRDQGTLIATAWKFNLQNHKKLPMKYNYIADFYNPNYTYLPEKGFTSNNFETTIIPIFIHIYHEFGHKGWEIWDKIEEIKKENDIH